MKLFLLKLVWFVFPLAFLNLVTFCYYSYTASPDLLRLGYIPNVYKDYRRAFNLPSEDINYELLSQTKRRKFKILTIGDSFSEQGSFGYKNYLAKDYDVLHVDRFISKNQIQTLCELINGDFFEKYKISYVVLQNVQRNFFDNVNNLDDSKVLDVEGIDSIINSYQPKQVSYKHELFSRNSIVFPCYYLPLYYLKETYLSNNQVYNTNLNSNLLFSTKSDKLLFYSDDLKSTKENNNTENVHKLNNILNEISEKLKNRKIELIVLPAPDKYDIYFEYITDKSHFIKPIFFEHLDPLIKKYTYINSKEILSLYLNKEKDIYFYDGTHWSPVGSKIISNEIVKVIKANE